MKKLIGFVLLGCLAIGAAWAQSMPNNAPTPQRISATAPATHFNVEAATNAYMAELSPAQRARSDAYFEGGYWLILWDLLIALGVAWLLLGTRLSARMRNLAERITRLRWLQTAIYVVQYIVLTSLITLPWNLYEGWFREHQYGLSNLTLGGWFGEQAKGLIVGLVLGTVALVVIYAVIRKATRTWWLWGAGVALVFMVFVATIAPVYIAPLFNTYKSLPESPLKTQILSMARANGIPATDVYWFDASRQSKRISANVSGMFNTTRISLNDNLLHRSTPEEIKAVLGHEMGHYVLNHVYKGIVFFGIIIVLAFAFLRWGFGWAERRWGERWGLRGVGDVAGLPLLAALLAIFMFVDDAGDQHHHPQHGSRGRRVRPECRARTRRFRPGGGATVRIPQDASRPGRGIHLLRPSQRLASHPSRDGMEGRKPRRSGGASRRGDRTGGRALNDALA